MRLLFTILSILCFSVGIMAQRTVSGTVTSTEGEPLIGVNVLVKGTTTGTVTDFDGKYSVSVPNQATLEFSYTGYTPQEVNVTDQSVIDITLEEGIALGEVVVTALGIEREKSSLTFAQQTVEGTELLEARDINFLNSLSGKAAGVEIKKSSSGPGGSTRVVLRGDKSLNGNSDPLFVIDGIPMANNRSGQPGMWGGFDGGDGMSQINPDDIESITVLRGSNAAALYGSQGANGVVLITTKEGKEGPAKVSVSSGITVENIMLKPDLQFRYGSEGGTKESWSTTRGNYDGSYVDDFFQTGTNQINSISISGGTARTKAYFSFGNVNARGITPQNTYNRYNVTFKQSTKMLNDKLTVGSNIILTNEVSRNRPAAGYYLNPLTGLYFFPRDRDFASFRDNYSVIDPDRNVIGQNWFVIDHHQSNPYWLLNEQPRTDQTNRMIGSVTLDYQITEKLSVSARGNYDFASKLQEQQFTSGGNTTNIHPNGSWDYWKFTDELLYTDALLKFNDNFGDFSLGLIGGASYQKTVFGLGTRVDGDANNGLLYANEFFFQNLPPNVQVQSTLNSRLVKQALFANATIGFKEMLFLDLSGRNDWASTLAGTGNESYFYPSFGATAVLSKMFELPEAVSFAKIRYSNSKVGNEVPYNVVNPQNTIAASGGVNRNTQQPFENLKPEIITSSEFGTNWRFFDDRFGFDLTYYNTVSTDQFINLPAPSGSGYTRYYVNAGKIINKGIELVVDVTPIYTPKLTWTTSFNFWTNDNEVVEMHPDLASITTGQSEGYGSRFEAGGSIGDIYVYKFQRDAQNRIILDENDGRPLKTAMQELAGNLNPDWSLGWNNNFKFGKFGLNFIVNGKFGGVAFSQTESMLDGAGVSERTAADRDAGGTTIDAVQGDQPVSTIDPELYYRAIGDRNGIGEPYVYDRTNVRLTQFSLSYRTSLFNNTTPVTLSLVGQNLFFLYLEAPFDPELAMSTNRNAASLDNFNTPATRTIGFNINVNF
ncbi:SusC/RagA family TonB-linked outer membrane protein [Flavilitoribacter nigricans]|uniref:TonB-dependent receptor n=1 Tax=Flavilitoribacter nigricans (strain ATCC 23147 / DSM 23189 / NBRC 102662 / NCIMB 1420 / SS-2) TaxID=1122177 RepID=A0A2D0N6Y4_FLAN2|nr:SusC/RagA family TonB-linked outer membrane protein [Flavilitoribacter nigricans]PHN04227.1 TonB-dependent receptor [Flavilitoribacter nigricans DSM 23189 = NBRC 102662]